jgi:hypothetical protein
LWKLENAIASVVSRGTRLSGQHNSKNDQSFIIIIIIIIIIFIYSIDPHGQLPMDVEHITKQHET